MVHSNLNHLCGAQVEDDGELHRLGDIIDELESFVDQFSTHSMNDGALWLKGQKEAYQDVIDYLKRVNGVE